MWVAQSGTAGDGSVTWQDRVMTDSADTVALTGDLDVAVAPDVRQRLDELLARQASGVGIVDLRDVTFLDSAILGVLVGAARRARDAGGDLEVHAPPPMVRRLFAVTGVD